MLKITAWERCSGCGVCMEICPTGAIRMEQDEEGFHYPSIAADGCVDCGVCAARCPVRSVAGIRQQTHGLMCFAAHQTDASEQLSCASGGVATSLARRVIAAGGAVCGVIYGEDYRTTKYICTREEADLARMKGSKYIASEKGGIHQQVKEELEQGLVLFIGMPCDVAGMLAYLGGDHKNLITCELICHGVTSPAVQRDYLDDLESRLGGSVRCFTVRYKKDGWYPPHIRAVMENGAEEIVPFYDTAYGYAYDYFLRPSCNHCVFKGEDRCADITLGDFLGMTAAHPAYSDRGVSCVMINSEKGRPWIENLSGIDFTPVPFEEIVKGNKRMSIPARPKPQREEVRAWVCGDGLMAGWRERQKRLTEDGADFD